MVCCWCIYQTDPVPLPGGESAFTTFTSWCFRETLRSICWLTDQPLGKLCSEPFSQAPLLSPWSSTQMASPHPTPCPVLFVSPQSRSKPLEALEDQGARAGCSSWRICLPLAMAGAGDPGAGFHPWSLSTPEAEASDVLRLSSCLLWTPSPGPATQACWEGREQRGSMCPYFLAPLPRPPLAERGLFILQQELFQP